MSASEMDRDPEGFDGGDTHREHLAIAASDGTATLSRVTAAEERALAAARRDDRAKSRDIDAAERDRASDLRDHEIARAEELISPDGPVT